MGTRYVEVIAGDLISRHACVDAFSAHFGRLGSSSLAKCYAICLVIDPAMPIELDAHDNQAIGKGFYLTRNQIHIPRHV